MGAAAAARLQSAPSTNARISRRRHTRGSIGTGARRSENRAACDERESRAGSATCSRAPRKSWDARDPTCHRWRTALTPGAANDYSDAPEVAMAKRIKFGVTLPQFGATWPEVRDMALLADEAGFDSVWV